MLFRLAWRFAEEGSVIGRLFMEFELLSVFVFPVKFLNPFEFNLFYQF